MYVLFTEDGVHGCMEWEEEEQMFLLVVEVPAPLAAFDPHPLSQHPHNIRLCLKIVLITQSP